MLSLLVVLLAFFPTGEGKDYYGKLIGDLMTKSHQVSGKVYAASEMAFYLVDFTYDGQGTNARFMVGTTTMPDENGEKIMDEGGKAEKLKAYTKMTIAVTLPAGKKINDFKYFSVFGVDDKADYGHVVIPDNFEPPKERSIGVFQDLTHGLKVDDIILKDSRTVFLKNFHYDGKGPNASFCVGTTDDAPGTNLAGMQKMQDENNSDENLKQYTGKDITLKLHQGGWADYKWFAVVCIKVPVSFGHVILKAENTADIPAHIMMMTDGGDKGVISATSSPGATAAPGKDDASRNLPPLLLLLGLALFAAFQWDLAHSPKRTVN